MANSSYNASTAYFDSSYGWTSSECSQGNGAQWGAGSARWGIMYFSGLSALKGKIISGASLSFRLSGGYSAGKTLRVYTSNYSGIGTSGRTGSSYIGTALGTISELGNGTYTKDVKGIFAAAVASGNINDTFVLYSASAGDYTKVWNIALSVTWEEPYERSTLGIPSSFTIGAANTLTATRAAGSANTKNLHTFRYLFGSAQGVIGTEKTEAASILFTPDYAVFGQQIPDANVGIGRVWLETYTAGGVFIGEHILTDRIFTMPDTAASKPVSGIGACSSVNSYSWTGANYVRGYSNVRFAYTPTAQYGASVRSVSITANGTTAVGEVNGGTATIGPLSAVGANSIAVTVVDSRGFKNTSAINGAYTVLDYAPPAVTVTGYSRTATAMTVNIARGTSYLSGNAYTARLYYKTKAADSFSQVVIDENTATVSGLNADISYVFYVSYTDNIATGSTAQYELASTNRVPFHFSKEAFAIGKTIETPNLIDMAWPVRCTDALDVMGKLTARADAEVKGTLGVNGTLLAFQESHFGAAVHFNGATAFNNKVTYNINVGLAGKSGRFITAADGSTTGTQKVLLYPMGGDYWYGRILGSFTNGNYSASVNYIRWGIDAQAIASGFGFDFYEAPVSADGNGTWDLYNAADGAQIGGEYTGYGATFTIVEERWYLPARMYRADGTIGGWQTFAFPQSCIIWANFVIRLH